MNSTVDAPVLIAGGGLVGMSLAMFLAQHGIASLVVERLSETSPLPRAAFFHMRTMELFRSAGIEEAVRVTSAAHFEPEGKIVVMDRLSGHLLADVIGNLNEGVDALSPCRRLFVNQPGLEPILRDRALAGGAQLLHGYEVTGAEQDAEGTTLHVRSVSDGSTRSLRGRYLVGADGAHSLVRQAMGATMEGRGVFSNSVTIYFTANLSPWLDGKSYSLVYVNNETLGAFFRMSRDNQSGFLGVNTVGDPYADPEAAANAAADVSEERLVELVRAAVGDPRLPVTIDGVSRWRAVADVASSMRQGRIFLAGDSAHLMPPNGGFGGNTGIHDAHNLAWKLAHVLNSHAGESLLASYEEERQPAARFTVEQAFTRYVTRTATYLGNTDHVPLVDDFQIELGIHYRSSAIIGNEGDPRRSAAPSETRGLPGYRLPHCWLELDGNPVSSIDLVGSGFVLLAGPDGDHWQDEVMHAARIAPVELRQPGRDGLRDPTNGGFAKAIGIEPDGAVLVRPDGYVAWRADRVDRDGATLARIIARLSGKDRAVVHA